MTKHWALTPRIWVPFTAFLVTRLGIALVGYVAEPLMVDNLAPPPYHIRPDQILLDIFGSRWDTGFYLSIATEGYRHEAVPLPSTAFFPLLPILIGALTIVTGDMLFSGLIVSNAALLGASVLFYSWVDDTWGAETAGRSVWYLLLFPASLFGSAIYSESLYLLLGIGAVYAAGRGRWGIAAVLAYGAGLTRLLGVLVAVLLIAQAWRDWRGLGFKTRILVALAIVAAPLGLLSYMSYLGAAFGDPLAFAHASAAWGRVAASPLQTLGLLVQTPPEGWPTAIAAGRLPLDNWIDALSVAFFLGLGLILLGQRQWGPGLYVTLGALLPLSSGLLMSQRRYMWILFPAFVLLARWGARPGVDRAIATLFALGLGLCMALFANWYWVG
ncbi:MAG TPA: mannosyltransferase family protein [Anaerolineales bacterium]|nr:mannosyltransferase family protein [Anaerolineales bacterium]